MPDPSLSPSPVLTLGGVLDAWRTWRKANTTWWASRTPEEQAAAFLNLHRAEVALAATRSAP